MLAEVQQMPQAALISFRNTTFSGGSVLRLAPGELWGSPLTAVMTHHIKSW